MQGGFVEREPMHSRPQIQHVALSAAFGLEALEDVLAQVRRERALRIGRLRVDRARAAALLTAARSRNAVRRPRATAIDARATALLTVKESPGTSRLDISSCVDAGIAGENVTSNADVPTSRRPASR